MNYLYKGIEFCTKFRDLNLGGRTIQGTHYTRGPTVYIISATFNAEVVLLLVHDTLIGC